MSSRREKSTGTKDSKSFVASKRTGAYDSSGEGDKGRKKSRRDKEITGHSVDHLPTISTEPFEWLYNIEDEFQQYQATMSNQSTGRQPRALASLHSTTIAGERDRGLALTRLSSNGTLGASFMATSSGSSGGSSGPGGGTPPLPSTPSQFIYTLLRKYTTAEYETLDEINWGAVVVQQGFWYIFENRYLDMYSGAIGLLDYILRMSGNVNVLDITGGVIEYGNLAFYQQMFAGKELPTHYQIATDPLDCFLLNHSAFCVQDGNRLVCDLSSYSSFKTKRGGPRYGGRAVIVPRTSERGARIESIDGEVPGSDKFEEKQNIFLSTFAVELVANRHATITHLVVFQRLMVKFIAPFFQQEVESNPKIRKLYEVLFTRTNVVSLNELLLIVGEDSLVGRVTSFATGELTRLLRGVYDTFCRKTPIEIRDHLSSGDEVWHDAAMHAWNASVTLVEDLFRDAKSDSLFGIEEKEELTLLVWVGTYYHTFIGDLQVLSVMNGCLPFYCTGRPHQQTVNMAVLSGTIGVTTMTRTYDLQFVCNELTTAQGVDHWKTFVAALQGINNGLGTVGGITGLVLGSSNYPSVNF